MLMCRSEEPCRWRSAARSPCSPACPVEAIVSARDVADIYSVPIAFREQGVDDFILEHFGLEAPSPDLSHWQEPIERAAHATRTVRIALVGKYVRLEDAYLSVTEALRHASHLQRARVEVEWVDSETLEPQEADEAAWPRRPARGWQKSTAS